MTLFYLFRHGETDMNKQRRWQGKSIDSLLNENGRRQAENLACQMKDSGIEIIYSSPLKRALETADIVGRTLNVPVLSDERFIEGSLGDAEGMVAEDIEKTFPFIFRQWHILDEEHMDVRFPNGDSKREMQTRMLQAMKSVAEQSYQTVGIVAHSAVIRYFLLSMNVLLPNIPHDRPLIVSFDNGVFSAVRI